MAGARLWRRRSLSSRPSPAISWASPGARCSRRWSRAPPTPPCWPTWRGGCLRRKLPALRQALVGRFRPHHAFVLGQLLAHLDYLDEAIATLSTEIERVMPPFAEPLRRLDTIPGINQRTAEVILAEVGTDMRVFPSARHLASWAALCPGQHESAGKHKSGKTRKGNRWLRTALIEAAAGASRAKNSALQARFRRVLRHR